MECRPKRLVTSSPTRQGILGSCNSSAPDVEPSMMRIRALDAGGSAISGFSNSVSVG
jgi:hypothetical protein